MPKTTGRVVDVVRTILRPSVLVLIALAAGPSNASAQLKNLDDRAFMEALQRRGMIDVMNHFMANNKTKDPLLDLQFQIAAKKAAATQMVSRRNPAAVKRRKAAALEVIDLYHALFKKAPEDHWEQPLWKTDYCDWVLGTVLPDRYVFAHLFVQHGRPTNKEATGGGDIDNQQEAYDKVVGQVLKVMEQAAFEHREIGFKLNRDPDFQRNWVNTGKWQKFDSLYGQVLLPFHHAWAIYHGRFMTKPAGDIKEADGLMRAVMSQGFMNRKNPSEAVKNFKQQVYSRAGRISLKKKDFRSSLMYLDASIYRTSPVPVKLPAAIGGSGGIGGIGGAIWEVPKLSGQLTNDGAFQPKISAKTRSVLVTKKGNAKQDQPTLKITMSTGLAKIYGLRLDAQLGKNKKIGIGRNGNFLLSEIKVIASPLKPNAKNKGSVKVTLLKAVASNEAARKLAADAIDGKVGLDNGWSAKTGKFQAVLFVPKKPFGFAGGTKIQVELVFSKKYGTLGNFRFAVSGDEQLKSPGDGKGLLNPIDLAKVPKPEDLAKARKATAAARKKAEAKRKAAAEAQRAAAAKAQKSSAPDSMIVFESKLAKAYALAGSNRKSNGIGMLADMRRVPPASQAPLLLILITDAQYLMDGGDVKAKIHYRNLIKSPEANPWRGFIEDFIAKRDGAGDPNIDDEDLDRFFASMRILLNKASGFRAEMKSKEALREYTNADGFLDRFLATRTKDLSVEQLGKAWDMRGRAQYNRGVLDLKNGVKFKVVAARSFLKAADIYAGAEEGEKSVRYALSLATGIYRAARSEGKGREASARDVDLGFKILFAKYNKGKFPETKWYIEQKYYYGEFLTSESQWGAAFAQLGKVSTKHPLYNEALYRRVRCAHNLWIDSKEKEQKTKFALSVRNLTNNVLRDLASQLGKAKGDAAKTSSLRRKEALVRLNVAEVEYEQFREPARAKGFLQNFDKLYGDFPTLVIRKQRIYIAVSIQTGNLDAAKADIQKLVEVEPDRARQLARDLVPALKRQAEAYRSDGKTEAAQEVMDYALDLVENTMLRIAIKQGKEIRIQTYEILFAQTLLDAGKTDMAHAKFIELKKKYPKSLNVAKGMLDCLVFLKKEKEARLLARQIDEDLQKRAVDGTLNGDQVRIYWDSLAKLVRLWDMEFERRMTASRTDVERGRARNYGTKIWKFLHGKFEMHGKSFGPSYVNKKLGDLHTKHDPIRNAGNK